MRPKVMSVTLYCMVLLFLAAPVGATKPRQEAPETSQAFKLLTIGAERPNEVQVDLRVKSRLDKPIQDGDRVVLDVTTQRSVYLTVFSVSSSGAVMILYPLTADGYTPYEPGRKHTLWNQDAGPWLVLGEPADAGGVVLFLTAEPLDLCAAGLKGDLTGKVLEGGSTGELANVIALLQKAADGTPWFNRVVLPWGGLGRQFEVRVQTSPSEPSPMLKKRFRALPKPPQDSTPPEPLTGAAGARPENEPRK